MIGYFGEEKSPEKPSKYLYNNCNYNTMSNKDFDIHKLTLKHKNRENGEEWRKKVAENPPYNFIIIIENLSKNH